MAAPLSTFEEAALRKIGFGAPDYFQPAHIRRLLQLELIEWKGERWHLTPVGLQRYDTLLIRPSTPRSAD